MAPNHQPEPPRAPASGGDALSERSELLGHVQAVTEPAMTGLGIVFLVLLLMDFGSVRLIIAGENRLGEILNAIWIVFLVDFLVRLVIAPAKGAFLRANVLTLLSLALPFLRPLRALRAVRAVRSLSLVRLLGGINRGMRVLRRVTRGRQLAYVGALTVMVVFAGAMGVLFFDRDVPDAPVQTFGDALWWSAAMVTTINNEKYAVSVEARVIAILQRIFAVSVFGFITASIASYLIGADADERRAADERDRLAEEVRQLRVELAEFRSLLEPASGRATEMGEPVAETDEERFH